MSTTAASASAGASSTSSAPSAPSAPPQAPPTAPATTPAPPRGAAPSPAPADPPNPLDQLGSMFSGWMSAAHAAAADAANTVSSAAAAAAPRDAGMVELGEEGGDTARMWESAGRMWESAVHNVGETLEAAKIDEKVTALRGASQAFMGDVAERGEEFIGGVAKGLDGDEMRKRGEEMQVSARGIMATASEQWEVRKKEALDIFVDSDKEKREKAAEAGVGVGTPPWAASALPEAEKRHADALQEHMLKIVVDSIYSKKIRKGLFLSAAAEAAGFAYDAEADPGVAMAILEADQNMRRLRSGLVPQKIGETVFWNEYFYQVKIAREALLANGGVMPARTEAEAEEDDAALFGDDDDDEGEEIAALGTPVLPPKAPVVDEVEGARQGGGSSAPTVDAGAAGKTSDAAGPAAVSGVKGGERDWENEIDALFGDDEEGDKD